MNNRGTCSEKNIYIYKYTYMTCIKNIYKISQDKKIYLYKSTSTCAGDTDCTFIYFMTLSRSCLAVSHLLSIHLCTGARMWLEVGETEDSIVDAMYQEPQCGGGSA